MREHSQNGLDDVLHLLVGQPLLLAQHLLADESLLDVGVVNRRAESEERELEGELFGEVDVEDEPAALVGTGERSINQQFPMEQVLLERRHYTPTSAIAYCSFMLSRTSPNYFYSRFIQSFQLIIHSPNTSPSPSPSKHPSFHPTFPLWLLSEK
jgi:hypothetical protein